MGNYFAQGLSLFAYVVIIVLILPFVIIAVNADYKARKLKGIIAKQNYHRIFNNGKSNSKKINKYKT